MLSGKVIPFNRQRGEFLVSRNSGTWDKTSLSVKAAYGQCMTTYNTKGFDVMYKTGQESDMVIHQFTKISQTNSYINISYKISSDPRF